MKFTYTATNADGATYTRTVEAENRFEVYGMVRKEGGTVVTVDEGGGGVFGAGGLSIEKLNELFGRIKETDKILFTRNLSVMLSAGLSLSRALDVLARQTKNFKLKKVINDIKDEITKGGELHTALEKHDTVFNSLVVSMVRAGEESGQLAEALLTISAQLESAYELKRKIRGAMIYPAIIVATLGIIGTLMLMFIVPTLTETFVDMGVDLPLSTQFIIALSDFLINNTVLFLILIVSALGGGIYGLRTRVGKDLLDTALLYIPMIKGLAKEINAARAARTLSSLLSAGVGVVQAFEITEAVVQNHHFKRVIAEAREQVQTGKDMSSVFLKHEHLYPSMMGELLAVGEETGKLPDMLGEVARFYEGEIAQKTKNMSTFIEPFLMLIVGAAVGFFALSMISPIYSITTAF